MSEQVEGQSSRERNEGGTTPQVRHEKPRQPQARPNNQNNRTPASLQDRFINKIKDNRLKVSIFLSTGFNINGIITESDNYTILVKREKSETLLFKSAIASIELSGDGSKGKK